MHDNPTSIRLVRRAPRGLTGLLFVVACLAGLLLVDPLLDLAGVRAGGSIMSALTFVVFKFGIVLVLGGLLVIVPAGVLIGGLRAPFGPASTLVVIVPEASTARAQGVPAACFRPPRNLS